MLLSVPAEWRLIRLVALAGCSSVTDGRTDGRTDGETTLYGNVYRNSRLSAILPKMRNKVVRVCKNETSKVSTDLSQREN